MSNPSRAIFLFLTIVAVLLVSAVGTTSVYADDGTPPPPATETAAVDPATEGSEPAATEAPVEVAPTSEPVVAEPPVEVAPTSEPVVAEPPVEAAPTSEPVVAEPTEAAPVVEEQQPAATEAASILEQVPEDTVVTVLNAEGEAQPLTSQDSANAITTSDPVWCPGSALPGSADCTEPFDSFDALLSFLKEHEGEVAYQQGGTIYVEMGTYAGPETTIDFNSYNFNNFNQYDLTVQGGWNTSNNDTSSTTTLNVPITVGSSSNPWAGSLTFNNIWINGVANQTGLTLVTDADSTITLSNVQVTNSLGGADLTAGSDVYVSDSNFSNNQNFGARINSGGYVEVRNSTFDHNKSKYTDGFGLEVDNAGDTFISAVSASYNETFGADINSGGYVAVTNSVFSGNISYSNCPKPRQTCHGEPACKEVANGGYGLKIVSTVTPDPRFEAVTLDGVTADGNYLFGAHIEAADAKIVNSSFSKNGSGALNNPQGYGLEVLTTGGRGVTLDNVHADNNQRFGANITAGAEGVTISNSFFDGNKSYYDSCTSPQKTCHDCTKQYYGYGLQVVTTGDIDLSTVSASNNYLYGAHLDGANIGISNGTFSNNANDALTGEGLKVKSTGNVNLFQVAANNNQAFGGDILAAGNVNITLSTFSGQTVYTYSGNCTDQDKKTCYENQPCVKTPVGGGYGLRVWATGTTSQINLSGVTASDNYLSGMDLKASHVQISGNGTEYSRAERNREGVKIESTGSVSIDMLMANDNALSGATIMSGLDATLDGTVLISNSFFSGNASYVSSHCKGTTYAGYGLKVVTTSDDISLVNVEANDNYLYGAYLQGASIDVSQSVFNSNGTDDKADHIGKGLEIVSTGVFETVSLNNVEANYNQIYGANIKAEGFVSVSNSLFVGNASYSSNCSKSKSSGSSGGKSSGGSKTCHECTTTYDGYGLQVVTTGDIYVGNVTADKNYLFGARLEGANVTVQDSTFNSNASPTQKGKDPVGRGLVVKSTGNTSLQGVEANNNQVFGADVEAGGNVQITSSLFNSNTYSVSTTCQKKTAGYGLKVVAAGTIDLGSVEEPNSGIEASNNGAQGAILEGQTTVNVVDSLFNNNGADGLNVTANNDVTLTNVTATGNKGDGAEVTGVCTNVVHVDGGTFANNSKYGLKLVKIGYDEVNPPSFSGNGSGGLFQNASTCVTSASSTSSTSTSSGNTSGSNNGGGWNWYWWWFWNHSFGRH